MNYIQYGCGHRAPETWENFDSSPTIVLERLPLIGRFIKKNDTRFPANVRRGDIVHGLPVSPGSVQGVYCAHTLEHLSLDDFRTALRNTLVMLKPGGVFRLVVPDLEFSIRTYVADSSPTAAHTFMDDTMLGVHQRPRGPRALLKTWLGGSDHLWMWDFKAMRHELEDAGFTAIRRAEMGDADDRRFDDVESADRWINCLGVECRRPQKT